jgi:hypothetical protein
MSFGYGCNKRCLNHLLNAKNAKRKLLSECDDGFVGDEGRAHGRPPLSLGYSCVDQMARYFNYSTPEGMV